MIFLLLVPPVILLFVFIKMRYINSYRLRREYTRFGVVTVGARGKGKDVAHALASYKASHHSNLQYHDNTIPLDFNDLKLVGFLGDTKKQLIPPQLVDGDYEKYTYIKQAFEGENVFISDGGVYFASWLDTDLKKQYPSLPIVYALWRHLYNSGFHVNTQVFSRLWLVLREQAEFVVDCQGCRSLFGWLLLKVRTYTRYEDAELGLSPLKTPLFGKKKSMAYVENSARGEIQEYRILVPKKILTYDSRAFHQKIFKTPAPSPKKRRKRDKKKLG